MQPGAETSQAATDFLRFLAPMALGQPFDARFVLESITANRCIDLHFRDLADARPFSIRITPRREGRRFLATAGRMDLSLVIEGDAGQEVVVFVRKTAALLRQRTEGVPDAALEDCFRSGQAPLLRKVGRVPREKMIDLRIGHVCNANCKFCTDRLTPEALPKAPLATLTRELERVRAAGFEGVTLTGLEPTLRTDLPELIGIARGLGFAEIHLISNGGRLADIGYMEAVKAAGLTVLILSLHAATAEVEDAITGRPGLFAKKRQVLENVQRLFGDRATQDARGTFFRTNSVMVQQNLSSLPALVALLEAFQSSLIVLCYPWIKGKAARDFAGLVPDYAAVAEALAPMRSRILDSRSVISLANLPPCVLRGLPVGTTQYKNLVRAEAVPVVVEGGEPEITLPSKMDESLGHPAVCDGCAMRGSCAGVSSLYLQHYGTLGLRTLTPA